MNDFLTNFYVTPIILDFWQPLQQYDVIMPLAGL